MHSTPYIYVDRIKGSSSFSRQHLQHPSPHAGGTSPFPQPASSSNRRKRGFDNSSEVQHSTTPLVWIVVWSIACAGFLVGYSSGANVAISHTFRHVFLPQLPAWKATGSSNMSPTRCNEEVYHITWYLAPKYIAGFVAALPAGWLIRVAGRRTSMGLGCGAFVVAHLLRGCSSNLAVLLLGQAVDGIACAFLYQAPFLEAAEVAPPKWRGACGYSIHLGRSIGVFCRSLLVEGIAMQPTSPPWGWRLVVLFPIWPAFVFMLLLPLLPETPSSLMQRGQLAAARPALQDIRGELVDVDAEYDDILEAAGIKDGQGQRSPLSQFHTLVQRQQLPPLIIMLVMTVIREYTGSDFLVQYSQPLRLGLGLDDVSVMLVLRQVANLGFLIAGVLGCLLFDTWGRRPILLMSSTGCCCCYVALAAVLTSTEGHTFRQVVETGSRDSPLQPFMQASVILANFFYSTGWAIGYVVLMAELFPLSTRSLAMSLVQGLAFCMYAVSSSTDLRAACEMRVGLLWLFAAVSALATVFVYLCLPETKRVPLEEVHQTFQHPPHWLWSSCYKHTHTHSLAAVGNSRHASARTPRPPARCRPPA